MELNSHQRTFAFRAVGVVCVLLALLTGIIGAVHVHPASTNAAHSSCPTCALAHAGAVTVEVGHAAPVLISSETIAEFAETSPSFAPKSSLYIRPPPLV
ncbi:MAG: hypothetical protein DMG93_22225 [Acidobacteria bacterium]|nr:MAG: hypothetical protein DMG93_22225 [Acidobacteriota bacterium]